MKITFKDATNVKPVFKNGDFFLNEINKLRQIVVDNDGNGYQIIDPKDGENCSGTYNTVTELIKKYVISNGPIQKVEVSEIIISRTCSKLTREDF